MIAKNNINFRLIIQSSIIDQIVFNTKFFIFLILVAPMILISFIFGRIFPFVRNVSIKNEWCCIYWSLESTLGWSHWRSVLGFVLDTHCLNSFSCDRFRWSVLSEKFGVSHGGIVKCNMVVHWTIEILSVCTVPIVIVFRAFDIKVWNPAKFTINISVFWNSRIIWHSCSLDFIHLIWVVLSSWFDQNWLLGLESFIEILFIVSVICIVK